MFVRIKFCSIKNGKVEFKEMVVSKEKLVAKLIGVGYHLPVIKSLLTEHTF